MTENTNSPLTEMQKSIIVILQAVLIALLIWIGTSLKNTSEQIVSIQKDIEVIQRNQNDISKQIDKLVSKEVFQMHINNIDSRMSKIDERITKLEK